jgi:hypothetical protein
MKKNWIFIQMFVYVRGFEHLINTLVVLYRIDNSMIGNLRYYKDLFLGKRYFETY